MEKFKPINNDQLFLLPPSVEDFVPADHLARVIKEVVETIDVSSIESRYSHMGLLPRRLSSDLSQASPGQQ